MIIADSNLLFSLVMQAPGSETADAVWKRDSHWSAPPLIFAELRNILLGNIRRGLASGALCRDALSLAARIVPSDSVQPVDGGAVLALATRSGLSAYDAEFVVAGLFLEVPVVTWDKAILRAFPKIAISPEAFVSRLP